MPDTIVIADDVTGANDIGIMYTKAGHSSAVYSYEKLQPRMEYHENVVVIDTNSRFLSKQDAYQRVFEATQRFDKHKVHQFYNKQCSVFRGNIGAEFDAMLDALQEEFAVVVLGFPDNGRTTLNSIHYVHGTKLENSQFRQDPVHPMGQSNLIDILQGQTRRKVAAITYDIIDQGSYYLRQQINNMRAIANYVILDVRNNEDLAVIGEAVRNEKIICGSSALAYYLGLFRALDPSFDHLEKSKSAVYNPKVLCIAGSLTPQTNAQVQYMRDNHYPVIKLNTMNLFSEELRKEELKRILLQYAMAYQLSDVVVIHSMNDPEEVKRTKDIAAELNIDNTTVSEMVSGELAKIAECVGKQYGIGKYIICGGDTSAAFCNRLNIIGMKIKKEIQTGLPTCQSITEPYYQLVLKSGSFGTKEFIEVAKDMLLAEEA
jgi:uncharacterized protein YgbK (DUF1537 family)